ncbi:MAG: glycosyltransferase family 4 protein [Rhizobiaceae bacterium]
MHLLFVTSLVPQGLATTGYEIANQAVIDGLRRNGARVTVMGFTWPGKQASEPESTIVLGSVDVRTEGADPLTKMKWVAQAVAGGYTIASAKMRVIEPEEIRAAMQKHGPFDGYVLNGVSLPGAFAGLFTDLPSIWVAHNVEYISARENAETSDSALKRALFRRDARILERLEHRLAAQSRFVFTLAEADRAPLGVASQSRSACVPLVTMDLIPVSDAARKIRYDAGLIGTWTWQPNRVGLEWFISSIAPLFPEGFKVAVAGSLPEGLPVAPPCIEFVGRVADAKDFVRSCAVIPLVARGGTGVQLKTIETFELGLPSVATSSSLRGIDARPDNCIVADDPQAFAAALGELAAKTRAGLLPIGDGSQFHAAQRAALDKAITKGLAALSAGAASSIAA